MPQSLDNRTQRDLNPLRKHLLPPPVSTTAHHKLPSGSLSTDSHRQLVAYFRSGWAFLVPYLAAYLLYAWLKWPVNPAAGGEGLVKGMSESAGALPSTAWSSPPFTFTLTSLVPCLLHVYWFLHALHLVLGALALRAWWKESGATVTGATDDSENTANRAATPLPSTAPQNGNRSPSTVPLRGHRLPSTVYRLLPWFCLALLFYIPGVYLEWPSDPWEHLRRINEWRILDTVTAHSSWVKSSYFIPYSLLSWCVGLRQIFWLDIYYTGICLLLCWQYYRLARACDLGERASMVFVLLQALLFGNNIFSFYRYYGISSSIYAQLGAVALTRIVLEAAKHPELSLRSFFSVPSIVHRLPPSALRLTVHRQPPTALPSTAHLCRATGPDKYRVGSNQQRCPTVYRLLLSVLCILPLIRYNHAQGLGIAALGVAAVVIWRLIEWRHSALWWLVAATLVINVLFLWLYPRPAMVEIHRAQGFLNAWYGFNILNLTSSAGDRMLQIISVFGLINLAAAFVLICRNHVIAWITILPLVALLLPTAAVPFAQLVAAHGGAENIIIFQRMLFSIPQGLAAACLMSHMKHDWNRASSEQIWSFFKKAGPPDLFIGLRSLFTRIGGFMAFTLVCTIIAGFTIAPSSSRSYNRTWNAYVVIPGDLQLRDIFSHYAAAQTQFYNISPPTIITTQAGAALRYSHPINLIGPGPFRVIGSTATDSISTALDFLNGYAKDSMQQLWGPSGPTSKPMPIEGLNLIATPKLHDSVAWTSLSSNAPEIVSGVADLPVSITVLQNPVGTICSPFSPAMIAISRLKSYRLEMTVRQITNTGATAHLAVAWYDAAGNFLVSHVAPPRGAGNTRGWVGGTFSYFGLVGQSPAISWTTFGISFGLGELAAIPSQACYVRVGALLNQSSTPSAVIQLANIRLFEKATPEIGLAIPAATSSYSTTSQAASASAHWLPQQVAVERAGSVEILKAAAMVVPLAPK